MCGIGGMVVSEPKGINPRLLEALKRQLRHRGPDDSGIFVCPTQKCALVHTRLSILDLSSAGHQPMGTLDGRFQICFNGEIYNFKALRNELVEAGVTFKSTSDTEVLINLYARDGSAMLNRLEGMFAFAIWDTRNKELFLARDPLGIKPLFYWFHKGELAFASEFRALLATDFAPKRICTEGVGRYLRWGSVQEPDTLVQGVSQLPAGHSLLLKDGKCTLNCFWSLKFDDAQVDARDTSKVIRDGLVESLERHFVADVPVGLFLSGGIDSTAIAALAKVVGHANLETFCISFDDPEYDEGNVARKTADHFGTKHHDWKLTAEDGRELFHEFVDCMDQPSNDGLNTYCVAKFARRQGIKVVLSGLGGDELFGGYPSFTMVPKLLRIRERLGAMARSFGRLSELATRPGFLGFPQRLQVRRMAEFLSGEGTDLEAYWTMRGFFSTAEARSIIEDLLGAQGTLALPWLNMCGSVDLSNVVGAFEITRYMRNQLLRDSDVMSMANGLELRVPFVDRKFVDCVNRINPKTRYKSNKQLLLDAVPEIPQWVWQKKKQGFRFPLEKWVREDWAQDFEEIEKNTRVRLFSWYRKWAVFVLKRFIERHGLVV